MCGKMKIRIMRAYFYGRHVNLVWYGRRGIRMGINGDCGSFPCI
jgi:hypothetical protein